MLSPSIISNLIIKQNQSIMKFKFLKLLFVAFISLVIVQSCVENGPEIVIDEDSKIVKYAKGELVPDQYIVVFTPEGLRESEVEINAANYMQLKAGFTALAYQFLEEKGITDKEIL